MTRHLTLAGNFDKIKVDLHDIYRAIYEISSDKLRNSPNLFTPRRK